MSLTQEEIDKISENLSKIEANNIDAKNINDVLKYIELLNEVDTENVKPTISVIENPSKLREDTILTKNNNSDLLKCSKQKVISKNIAISNIMN